MIPGVSLSPSRLPRCDSIRKARVQRPEAEVLARAATIHQGGKGPRTSGVTAIGRRLAHRSEQGRERGHLLVDHVVDAMRR